MKNNKKILKRIASILVICLTLTAFGVLNPIAFAKTEIPIAFDVQLADGYKNVVHAGDKIVVDFGFDFDDISEAEGITVFNCKLKFDKEVLEIIDPETFSAIEVGEGGRPTSGNFYKIVSPDVADESEVSVVLTTDADSYNIFYGSRDAEGDLYSSGAFAQFAFRTKKDFAITNSISATIKVIDPDIAVANGDYTVAETGASLGVSVVPPFDFSAFGDQKQNVALELRNRHYIDNISEGSLIASVLDAEGNVIEEKPTENTSRFYNIEFDFNENLYAPGNYTFKLSYLDYAITHSFTIKEKTVVETPPSQDEPTDPDTGDDNSGNDNTGNDNTGDDNTGDNDTGDDNTGNENTDNDKGGTTTRPGGIPVDTNKPEADKPVNVTYPSDISGHWAEANVKYVYDNGLMNGYEDGTFGSEKNITRAEFATVISRLLGLVENPERGASFADCGDHWAKGYIGALASLGIVGGVNDTDFAPEQNITREQIAVILSRALKLEEPIDSMAVFVDDDSISDWAYSDVYKVLNAGYMKGDETGSFNPLASATRAEVATVIYRLHSQM